MEKNPGGQKFWQQGEGRFREILSCPPPPQKRVAPQMPPPIPPNSETWRRHWPFPLRKTKDGVNVVPLSKTRMGERYSQLRR